MKILILNWRDITHPWAGGAERHLHELAKHWVKSGNEVIFLCGGYKGALRSEKIDGIQIFRVGDTYLCYLLIPLYYIFKLRWYKFDCIIDTSHGIPFSTPLFTRKQKFLIIHHNHEKLWKTEFSDLVAKIGIFLENFIVPSLYKKVPVITLSESEKKLLQKRGFQSVEAILPGIEGKSFQKNREKASKPTILYLGRLRKYKRVDLLLHAFPEIKKRVPGCQLLIAGDGQDRARLEYIARAKNIDGNVVFKGLVSEDEKVRLLQQVWVLAFPSLIEGWGLVAMEAAACGTPTVGFNVPGIRDAVRHGETGLLVKSRKEFIESIVEILKNRQLRLRLSEGARNWVNKFSWDESSCKFMEVMKQVVLRNQYDENYFSNFWRRSYKRKIHPINNFRVWYILKFLNPKNLLDVGCGTGLVISKLRGKGVNAFGADISKEALSRIPPQLQKYCFLGDVRNLKFNDKSFDVVTCIDVLEHIERKFLEKAVKECARVAKRAVYFDITCLEDILFIHSDPTHVTKLYSWEWKKLIVNSLGFDWEIKRGFILPFIHHGVFVAERKE